MAKPLPHSDVPVVNTNGNLRPDNLMTQDWYDFFREFYRLSGTGSGTVAQLPPAGVTGRRYFVTDANPTGFGSVVTGGGTNRLPVYDDGTAWRIG